MNDQQNEQQQNQLTPAAQAAQIISAAARRYEVEQPRPDARPQDRAYIAWYRGQLLSIGAAVRDLGLRDLNQLDLLFRRVYLPHAIRSGMIPTIADFSLFCGIDADVLARLANRADTPGAVIYSNWQNIIKENVISTLSIEPGSNINLIFIAKAVHGIHEDKNTDTNIRKNTIKKSREEIIAELGGENVENSENVENL